MAKAVKNAKHVRIQILDLDSRLFLAQSARNPNEWYRVRLMIAANGLRLGECNCLGFERVGYCRHLAACVGLYRGILKMRAKAVRIAAERDEKLAVAEQGATADEAGTNHHPVPAEHPETFDALKALAQRLGKRPMGAVGNQWVEIDRTEIVADGLDWERVCRLRFDDRRIAITTGFDNFAVIAIDAAADTTENPADDQPGIPTDDITGPAPNIETFCSACGQETAGMSCEIDPRADLLTLDEWEQRKAQQREAAERRAFFERMSAERAETPAPISESDRRRIERENAPLIRPEPAGVKLDGWSI